MIVIGITGPTGSGKTTALAQLEKLGLEVVDCDALYHRMLSESESLRAALEGAFGPVTLYSLMNPAIAILSNHYNN